MDYYSKSMKVYQDYLNFEEECLVFRANKCCNATISLSFYQLDASLLDKPQVHFAYSIVLKGCHLLRKLLNKSELYCLGYFH